MLRSEFAFRRGELTPNETGTRSRQDHQAAPFLS